MLRIHKNRHIDDIAVHHVKYVKTAQLGEVFQAEHIPYKFIMKIKRLKMIKYIATHKVDLINLKTLEYIIRHQSKMLTSVLNYGPWFKSQIEKLKLHILQVNEVKLSTTMEYGWHLLHKLKNIQYLTIELTSEIGIDEESLLKTLNQKQLRLPKLKRINIQGNCTHIFDKLIPILNKNISYFTSLKEINLNMVYKIQTTQLEKMIPNMKIFSHIKEIKVGLGDQENIILSLLKYAEFLPRLEVLHGTLTIQPEADLTKLAEFKNLKTVELFIPRQDESKVKTGLARIVSTSRIPQALRTLKICLTHLEAQLIQEVFSRDQMTSEDSISSLDQLESITLVLMSVQPQVKGEHIIRILDALKRVKNLKQLSLDLSNTSHFDQIRESIPLVEMLNVISNLIPNFESLVLNLPVISLQNLLPETFKFNNLNELCLHGQDSLKSAGGLNPLLLSLNRDTLKRLTLFEITFENSEEREQHLSTLGEFYNLTRLGLSYKTLEIEDNLLDHFKTLSKSLVSLNYLRLKLGSRGTKFDSFEKRLNHHFAHVQFVKVDSYIKT